jgi:uncharacterized protein (TIGR03437 family)
MLNTFLLGAALASGVYGHLPLQFEPGPDGSPMLFYSHASHGVAFTPEGPVVGKLRMSWVHRNSKLRVEALDELPGKSNYFEGQDPNAWRVNVPNYARIAYRDVYPGIDALFHGNAAGELEYDWMVAPGADPSRIRIRFDGARRLKIGVNGDLLVETSKGMLRQMLPLVYQGDRKLAARYVLHSLHEVGFAVTGYDPREAMVIDPTLVYSTYLGGTSQVDPLSIAVDSAGNAYITGLVQDNAFPTVNPVQTAKSGQHAFAAKLNPAGTALIYATYLGGSGTEQAFSIAVDSTGNAYVVGNTSSTDFPVVNAFQPKGNPGGGFVTKLNPSGSALVYSTYLGGTGQNAATSIAVDASGSAYVAGRTTSLDFPVLNALQPTMPAKPGGTCHTIPIGLLTCDAGFVTKFSPSGTSLVYSTYLSGSVNDNPVSIAVDSAGNAFVAGITTSPDFPAVNALQAFPTSPSGAERAFVSKINAAGSALVFSTYLGGTDPSDATSIAVDSTGNAYVAGYTTATDYPTTSGVVQFTPAACQNPGCVRKFLTKLNPAGTARLYSTYVGGGEDSFFTGVPVIGLDAAGNVYLTGVTQSQTFPTVNPLQTVRRGASDSFVMALNATASAVTYATYLGGTGTEFAGGIAVDAAGNAYVTGETTSPDFPLAGLPLQPTSGNMYVAKIAPTGSGCVMALTPPTLATSAVATTGTLQVQGPAGCAWNATSDSSWLTITAGAGSSGNGTLGYAVATNSGAGPRTGTISVAGSPFVVTQQASPQVEPSGVVNAADYTPRVAPGSLIAIFGTLLSNSATATMNGTAAPVSYSSNLQVNVQAPFELAGQSSAALVVTASNTTASVTVPISADAPAIFTLTEDGKGPLATMTTLPVTAGNSLSIFCTGLGPVNPPVGTGVKAPITPMSQTTTTPVVVIGGVAATVTFAGLAPTFFGLYQVNVTIPAGITPGSAAPLTIQIGGATSNTVTVAIK